MKKIIKGVKNFYQQYRELNKRKGVDGVYRLVEVDKDDHGDYTAVIQVIGKNITFRAKPEEILADDDMTEKFSKKDIRTLTYLGYVDLNNPKYRILAKTPDAEDGKMMFAVRRKGEKRVVMKSADEISVDDEILKSLDQKDAHMVGYTTATEQTLEEEQQKAELRAMLEQEKKQRLEKKD